MKKRFITHTRFDEQAYRKVSIVTVIASSSSNSTYLLGEAYRFAILKVAKENTQEKIEEVKNAAEMIKNYGGNNSIILLDYFSHRLIEIAEHPWLLIDYIPGISLHCLLQGLDILSAKMNMLPASRIELNDLYKYKIVFAVSYTLRELHKHNYAHRNITASSILIDPNDLNPHIIDFSMVSSESTKYIKSSFSFTAPEYFKIMQSDIQSIETDPMTSKPSADVFSFGCVLLQVISFKYPLQDYLTFDENGSIKESQIFMDFERTGLFDPRFEPGAEFDNLITDKDRPLYDIVKECWAYHPEQRPTMDQVSRKIYELAKQKLSKTDFQLFNKYACSLKLENQPIERKNGDKALIKMKLLGTLAEVTKAIDIGFCQFPGSDTLKEAAKYIGIEPPQDPQKLDSFIKLYCTNTPLKSKE